MPKMIDHLQEKLLAEARRQVMENGYESLTIRSVAARCGVGVGTVYNYYPSKEALIANFLITDWRDSLNRIRELADHGADTDKVLHAAASELTEFYNQYADLFHSASKKIAAPPKRYHVILRNQIADVLLPLCQKCEPASTSATEYSAHAICGEANSSPSEPAFVAEFAAEALLTWTMEGKPVDDVCRLILKVMQD